MRYQLVMTLPPGTPANRQVAVGKDKLGFRIIIPKVRAKLEEFISQGKTGRYFTEYEIGGRDEHDNIIIRNLFTSKEAAEEWVNFVKDDFFVQFQINEIPD